MLKTLRTYLLLLFASTIFISCEKEMFDDPTPMYSMENVEWVLYSGRVYVENLDDGTQYYYNHFGPNKLESNLDIYGGSESTVDALNQHQTTWFISNGIFIYNSSVNYDYTEMGVGDKTKYTLIGVEPFGSSRTIIPVVVAENYITVELYESYESYEGVNYNYFSTLTFVRQGTSCLECENDVYDGYVYGGILNSVVDEPTVTESLNGTQWVITRYDEGMTPYYPNDTIDFISNVSYTINGGNWYNYSLSNIVGNNLLTLTLYECSTLGGNYSGEITEAGITSGTINNQTFNGIFDTQGNVKVWMEKIN